jgi:hypothetical protein
MMCTKIRLDGQDENLVKDKVQRPLMVSAAAVGALLAKMDVGGR